MYYLKYESKDISEDMYPFEVKVVGLPYDSLKPWVVDKFPARDKEIPIANLDLKDITLYLDDGKYIFRRGVEKE